MADPDLPDPDFPDPDLRDPRKAPEIGRLKRRADFLRVGKGKRVHSKAMTVQTAGAPTNGEAVRVGFTLTRKVGNAVVRNRARRRLKEAVRLTADLPVEPGHDYVIVGRIDAIRLPFDRLRSDLAGVFRALRRSGERTRGRAAPRRTEMT